MINFFGKPNEKIFNLLSLDKETLLYRVLPRLLLEIMSKYFRMEVTGLENLPSKGRVLITPNHSGFSGFDALLLGHVIHQYTRRVPRILTHQFWFLTPTTAIPAQKMGFTEATYGNGIRALRKNNLVVLFPEGEQGNFKPTTKMYELQEFKRGFVRMALETQSVIVPAVIIGAEETHINLKQFKFTKFLRGTVLPLPLNIIPLPVKWRIHFLPPIKLPYPALRRHDTELVHEIAEDIREQMQKALQAELEKRGGVFL